MEQICILGSTGCIGKSVLDVIECNADKYSVHTLVANRNYESLWEQIRKYKPKVAVLSDKKAASCLSYLVKGSHENTEVLAGKCSVIEAAGDSSTDVVVAAIVGAAGLLPTLSAIKSGKKVLLANKESLVMAGKIFMDTLKDSRAILLPVDSEHNAVFQCLPDSYDYREGLGSMGVSGITLTASGGPFLNWNVEDLRTVSPDQACAHPNWVMGKKISVDSATMMNKGLEMIEAHWLFNAKPEQLEVLVHPQSIIHSMVYYVDGSTLAQLAAPDMKVPIAQALAWPNRVKSGVACLSLSQIGELNFLELDCNLFPCMRLAQEAMRIGGTAATVLNAANEVAVEAFLNRSLGYDGIFEVIDKTMQNFSIEQPTNIENILDVDARARIKANQILASKNGHAFRKKIFTEAPFSLKMDFEC